MDKQIVTCYNLLKSRGKGYAPVECISYTLLMIHSTGAGYADDLPLAISQLMARASRTLARRLPLVN